MEKDGVKIKQNQKSRTDEVMGIISFLMLVAILLLVRFSQIGMEFFALITAIIFINSCIMPFIDYKKNMLSRETENNSIYILQPCITAVAGLAGIFIIYKVIFSQSIIREKNYDAYNYIGLFVLFYIITMQIFSIIKKIKALNNEKAKFIQYVVYFIVSIIPIIMFMTISSSIFLIPRKTIDLNNVKISNELSIYEISGTKYDDFTSILSGKREIDDNGLAELFAKKISEAKGENLRNLDRINYDIRVLGHESYIQIYPRFTKVDGNNKTLSNHIYEIRIHKNGDVMLVDYDMNKCGYYILLKKPVDIYRLNFSKEFAENLMNHIKK